MTWLMLITNLPGGNQTLRVRIWRALKAAGAGSLRDGVYLLPLSDASRRVFDEQVSDLESGEGTAQIIAFESESAAQRTAFRALFDRTDGYRQVLGKISALRRDVSRIHEAAARRQLGGLHRDLTAIASIDFFGGEARLQTESALADAARELDARFSPDEPHAKQGKIKPIDRKKYRGRTWATRERLWIDRVCSAWLIRRCIDPKVKFLWLRKASDCPKSCVGFDFDGAEFTHVGGKVTFEVLLDSFGLQQDIGLSALGRLVHFLDVGGVPVPEAAGLAAVVTGARALHADDRSLLEAVSPVLDSLYAAFTAVKDR